MKKVVIFSNLTNQGIFYGIKEKDGIFFFGGKMPFCTLHEAEKFCYKHRFYIDEYALFEYTSEYKKYYKEKLAKQKYIILKKTAIYCLIYEDYRFCSNMAYKNYLFRYAHAFATYYKKIGILPYCLPKPNPTVEHYRKWKFYFKQRKKHNKGE